MNRFDPNSLRHLSEHGNAGARIRRFNVLYLTPPTDPAGGLTIGDGETGALLWFDHSKLLLAVNRADLWCDGAAGTFCNWAREEEESSTSLRHGGRIELDFLLPVFDPNYLKQCRIELDLSFGGVSGEVESVFGTLRFLLLPSETTHLLRLQLEFIPAEDSALRLSLSHYGSRTYPHWYSRVENAPESGLNSTACENQAGVLSVVHRVSDGFFALGGVALVPGADLFRHTGVKQRHRIEAQSPVFHAGKTGMVELAFRLTGPDFSDACTAHAGVAGVLKTQAEHLSFSEDLAQNRRCYESFWQKGFLQCGDIYFDALHALHLFYSNASQRGRYPARFMQALWGFEHDFQPWNFYFHWNQQLTYFSLAPCGHPELNECYLRWRLDGLPQAREAAAALFSAPGGWVGDVTERRGYSSRHEITNRTVMAQIACFAYRQFCYCGDRKQLKEQVLPYLSAAAEFLFSLFRRGADGKYHIFGGSAYEGWILLDDCCTELNWAQALAGSFAEAEQILGVCSDLRRRCSEIAANLADLPQLEDLERFSDAASASCCAIGAGKHRRWRGTARLAAGTLTGTGTVVSSIVDRKATAPVPPADPLEAALRELQCGSASCTPTVEIAGYDGIFPFAELSVVFPSGNLDLARRREPLFAAAVNTAMLGAVSGGLIAWDPTAIHLSRLGMSELLFDYLSAFVSRWQRFPNGHFVDSLMARETISPLCRNRVADVESGSDEERRDFRAWEFRHLGTEGLSVVAAALTEAMLQSSNGVIRLFPAMPKQNTSEIAFTLRAEGGHRVSALRTAAGTVSALLVTLGWSGSATIDNSFEDRTLIVVSPDGARRAVSPEADHFDLVGVCGESFFCAPETEFSTAWEAFASFSVAEQEPEVRTKGLAQLGIKKLY